MWDFGSESTWQTIFWLAVIGAVAVVGVIGWAGFHVAAALIAYTT